MLFNSLVIVAMEKRGRDKFLLRDKTAQEADKSHKTRWFSLLLAAAFITSPLVSTPNYHQTIAELLYK